MILNEIVKRKRKDLVRAKDEQSFADVKVRARSAPPLRNFAIRHPGQVSVIAEIKRASPAKGILRANLDPAKQAAAYRAGGARAISVLTDTPFFQGSPRDLRAARNAVDLPILRKDFILEEYQLFETRILPADAALLIVRILEKNQLSDYLALAQEELSLPAIVEVHTEKELDQALDAGARTIGINNRNLEDFSVSLEPTERIRPRVPDDVTVVSESGISTRDDMLRLSALGVHAALLGEELVTASDPAQRIRELRGEPVVR